jgi:hypothetical protein
VWSDSGSGLESFDPLLGFADAKLAGTPVPKQCLFWIGGEGSQKRAPRENRIKSCPHSERGRPTLCIGSPLVI